VGLANGLVKGAVGPCGAANVTDASAITSNLDNVENNMMLLLKSVDCLEVECVMQKDLIAWYRYFILITSSNILLSLFK
jgi:hypothetical protein